MEIGISTASFYSRLLTEEAVDQIGVLGIKTCEVFLGSMSEYQPAFGEELKRKVKANDLNVYSVHSLSSQFEPQLFAATERQRRDSLEILKRIFEVAQSIGAETYVFHGPANLKRTTIHYDFPRIGQISEALAELAADFGLKFSWENVYWCYYNHPAFGRNLIEHCRSSNLHFTLDIKQAMLSGYDAFDILEDMGDRVVNVHAIDYDENGKLCLPGRGIFDFPRLYQALSDFGYAGPIMIEVYKDNYKSYEEIKECYQYLYHIFCSGG